MARLISVPKLSFSGEDVRVVPDSVSFSSKDGKIVWLIFSAYIFENDSVLKEARDVCVNIGSYVFQSESMKVVSVSHRSQCTTFEMKSVV